MTGAEPGAVVLEFGNPIHAIHLVDRRDRIPIFALPEPGRNRSPSHRACRDRS
jgi:hypothetical protein